MGIHVPEPEREERVADGIPAEPTPGIAERELALHELELVLEPTQVLRQGGGGDAGGVGHLLQLHPPGGDRPEDRKGGGVLTREFLDQQAPTLVPEPRIGPEDEGLDHGQRVLAQELGVAGRRVVLGTAAEDSPVAHELPQAPSVVALEEALDHVGGNGSTRSCAVARRARGSPNRMPRLMVVSHYGRQP